MIVQHPPRWWQYGAAVMLVLCSSPLPLPTQSGRTGARAALDSVAGAGLQLVINVPAYRLDVVQHDSATRSFVIAIGERAFPTPIGAFRVRFVIWNPEWNPPPSNWAKGKRREPPGPNNSMGRVKMHVMDLIYVHGTALLHSLGKASSHGCVRLSNEDAIAVARLVQMYGSPSTSTALIDSLVAAPKRTRNLPLGFPVPVEIAYQLAEVRDGRLALYPNVYARPGARTATDALQALAAAGYDTSLVDPSRLARLVRRSHRAATSTPVDSLFIETGAGQHAPPLRPFR